MRVPAFHDNPVNMPQPDLSDMLPNTASSRHKMANNKYYLDQRNLGWEYNIPTMIGQRPLKPEPLRDGINDVVRQSKIAGGKDKLLGAVPRVNARNQPASLAMDSRYLIEPLMPLPDNFYPALNTILV